jgi:hypothetical protein
MARATSVRLDDDAERALRAIEATGLGRSEAIRHALLSTAARLRTRQSIAAEVTVLEADEQDRAEMLEVAALMESLRAEG